MRGRREYLLSVFHRYAHGLRHIPYDLGNLPHVQVVPAQEAEVLRAAARGFCGYDRLDGVFPVRNGLSRRISCVLNVRLADNVSHSHVLVVFQHVYHYDRCGSQ